MENDNLICEIKWYKQDLIDLLIYKGIDFDDAMLDEMTNSISEPLRDRNIEDGWETMSILIDLFMYEKN